MAHEYLLENLLEQTKSILEENGLTIFDIEWFGTAKCEFICDLQSLLNVDYDDGFGVGEVDIEFILVGKDFWLERHEYDGSEWWEFKRMPVKPSNKKTVNKLIDYR